MKYVAFNSNGDSLGIEQRRFYRMNPNKHLKPYWGKKGKGEVRGKKANNPFLTPAEWSKPSYNRAAGYQIQTKLSLLVA